MSKTPADEGIAAAKADVAEAKFTSGPWVKRGFSSVYSQDGSHICSIHIQHGSTGPYVEANTNLIAAAPNMYDELERAKRWMELYRADIEGVYEDQYDLEGLNKDIETAGLALAKAEGRDT